MTDNAAHVDNVEAVWVTLLELQHLVCSVRREDTKTNNGDDTGNDAQDIKSRRQRKNTDADLVGDEDKGCIPTTHVLERLCPFAEDITISGRGLSLFHTRCRTHGPSAFFITTERG